MKNNNGQAKNEMSRRDKIKLLKELLNSLEWNSPPDLPPMSTPAADLFLSAWMDRMRVLCNVGMFGCGESAGFGGGGAKFRIFHDSADYALDEYMRRKAIRPYQEFHADQTELLFLKPKINMFRPDIVLGRYEAGYLTTRDYVIKKQRPLVVQINPKPNAEMDETQLRRELYRDATLVDLGLKVIRLTADEVSLNPADAARKVDQAFNNTQLGPDSAFPHPYDEIFDLA